MNTNLHVRQFLFTNVDLHMPEWRSRDLPNGWRLHMHPEAALEVLSASPEAPILRLGHALCVDGGGEIGAGRFALLRWPELLTDGGALLGLHYGEREGRQVVSSSAALADFVLHGRERAPDLDAPLEHRLAINYIPMPGAPFLGLRKLFHDQKLDLATFRLMHRPSPIRRLESHEAAVTEMATGLVRFAQELKARVPGTVYLPLTAGLDSRTLAAAFVAANLPFETVTLDFCGKPRSDIAVARAISRRLGLRHQVVRLASANPAAAERLRRHTSGAFVDWDITHVFPGDGYRYLRPGDAMIVGACFDVGRQTAGEHCFRGVDFASAVGADVWRRRTSRDAPPTLAALLDEWIAWRREHPLDMDFAAAFYLDQRLGGWRAALEHGYDLLPGISLCPGNDPRLYSALLTPSSADQRAGRLQKEVVALLAPALLDFPLNPAPLRQRLVLARRRLLTTLKARAVRLLPPSPRPATEAQ
jgi:hypothetical protein